MYVPDARPPPLLIALREFMALELDLNPTFGAAFIGLILSLVYAYFLQLCHPPK